MPKLRFRHVEAFKAVMLAGSVTGAASTLHVTQSAVSHLISETEDLLGFPLFDRRGGRVKPTVNADRLFAEIERCFLGLNHINEFAHRLPRSTGQTIIIAAVPVISLSILPSAIKFYREKIAEDFFTIHSRISEQVIGWVNSQKVDIGLANTVEAGPGICTETIARFDVVCALPSRHRLARKAAVDIDDLADEPFISLSSSEGIRPMVDSVFTSHGVKPRYVAECPMASAACAMVAAGIGIALVDPLAASTSHMKNVVFRAFRPAVPATFSAYWLASKDQHFRRGDFVKRLKLAASEIRLKTP
jgi:DNA-binding transcriptional LysR family regulator